MKNICHNFYRTIIFNASALHYDRTPYNTWYLEDKQAVCFLIECC